MTLGQLTKRETAVVMLLAEGHLRESISHQLDISINTVKFHMSNIYRKLSVNTALEVAAWYYRTNHSK